MKNQTQVEDLSTRLKNNLKLEVADDNTAKVSGLETAFHDNMPEELRAQSKKLHDYSSTFYTATALAVGEASIDAMKKNKKLQTVEAAVPLEGRSTYTVMMERSKEYPKPGSKTGEKITAFGVLNTKLDTVTARSNAGGLKEVRQRLQDAALAAFGS